MLSPSVAQRYRCLIQTTSYKKVGRNAACTATKQLMAFPPPKHLQYHVRGEDEREMGLVTTMEQNPRRMSSRG